VRALIDENTDWNINKDYCSRWENNKQEKIKKIEINLDIMEYRNKDIGDKINEIIDYINKEK
jgi:hypothetical protein